jgi:hypothetical protein
MTLADHYRAAIDHHRLMARSTSGRRRELHELCARRLEAAGRRMEEGR